jgi:hypothetical protein
MTPEDLESAVHLLFPVNGKSSMAVALGVDSSTLWRYAHRGKIPGPVSVAVSAWLVLKCDFSLDPPSSPCELRELEELAEMVAPGVRKQSGLLGVEAAAFAVFGAGWKTKLSSALGVDYSTIWRQVTSGNIHGPVMASVRAWLVLKRIAGVVPISEERSKPKLRSNYARLLLEDDQD